MSDSMSDPQALPLNIPFLEHIGARMLEYGDGRVTIAMSLGAEHCNSWRVAHGGVLMTLLDGALAIAAKSLFVPRYDAPGGMLTVEMKTMFIRPGDGELLARGHCVHKARKLAFCEGEIVDGEGRLIARASGTFKFWQPRPAAAGEESPQ